MATGRGALAGPSIFPCLLATHCRACPRHRSLLFFLPSHLTSPTERSQIHPCDEGSARHQSSSNVPNLALPPGHFETVKSLSTYAAVAHHDSLFTGTVWLRLKPAARRSSPTPARGWQAPFACPGRASKRHALYPLLFIHCLKSSLLLH